MVEIMIVVAIIGVLVVTVLMVSRGGSDSAKVKQTHAVMNSLKLALDEYKTATGAEVIPPEYHVSDDSSGNPIRASLPIAYQTLGRADYYRDCDPAGSPTPRTPLTQPVAHCDCAPFATIDNIWAVPDLTINTSPGYPSGYPNTGNKKVFGVQVLYYSLMQEPRSKQILSKLSPSSFGRASQLLDEASDYFIGDGARTRVPVEGLAILDGWGRPMYYGWDESRDTSGNISRGSFNNGQPYLQSAGPDGTFGNADDVFSYKD